jgi:hypothetical protein
MNTVNTSSPRGTVIKVPDATPGLLLLNGRQYSFTLEGVWRSAVAPAPNQSVVVDLDNAGVPLSITVVDQRARRTHGRVHPGCRGADLDLAVPDSRRECRGRRRGRGLLYVLGSRYLNAAPLAVVLLGWLVLQENMAGSLGQMGADNPFSYKWGFYLLLAACLALAANALKKPAA